MILFITNLLLNIKGERLQLVKIYKYYCKWQYT